MNKPVAAKLNEALAAAGFFVLGRFSSGQDSGLLIASTGQTLWPAFRASPEFLEGDRDPLDQYTRRTLEPLAAELGVRACFPFDGPPYFPFQKWALALGGFSQSPLGPLVHATYGPWLGFRAAFLDEDQSHADEGNNGRGGPCATCSDKPCLGACPVSAISAASGYDVPRCQKHLCTALNADCWNGCLARRACPFGRDFAQAPENARFHMTSFLGMD